MLGVGLLTIPVTDIDRSVSFYEEALGLAAKFVAAEYGWAQLDGASVAMALYVPGKGGGDRPPGGSVDFHLTHDRLDELHRTVRRAQPDAAVHSNDDGTRSLEFRDPDGNAIKIMQRD
jgi:catechol 2,3-dioxygenase-like lactoylglutathione lyase family enzyme